MKIGDKVLCIKDSDYIPRLKKGKYYIVISKYLEYRYTQLPPTKILHDDMFYVTTDDEKMKCVFSLVRKNCYNYFYDFFSRKQERKEKLKKLNQTR